MKKEVKLYIKLEIEDVNDFIGNIKTEIVGTDKNIKDMTVCLLSAIAEHDKKLVVEILMKFMEVV